MHKGIPHNFWRNAAVAALLTFATAGCSTVEGFGDDVESAGEAIESAADEARD